MSSRQRRRVARQGDLLTPPPDEEELSEASVENVSPSAVRSTNPYELLGGLEDDSDASEQEGATAQEELEKCVDQGDLNKAPVKKKKTRKKKQGQDDELDKLIHDIESSKVSEEGETETLEARIEPQPSIFALSLRSLRGDEELNRMFGPKVVASVEAELQQKRRQEAGRRGRGAGRHGDRRFMRNFILTDPQPEWNARESELSLISKGPTTDGEVFEYVASDAYQAIHERFLECQDMGDPNILSGFISKHPFHVEALVAMYDFLSATGSHLHAEECLNRALFALEAVWDRKFSPVSGRCFLSYEAELNQPLFSALFTHVQRLSKRGCLRTAFECCKFLLSLDRVDPLGTLCMIDYLAIRAGEFEFLEKLIEVLPDGPSLAVRPGISFSLALCRYKRGEREDSMSSLAQAVLMHPLALSRLMGKVGQTGLRMSSQWQELLQKPFLANSTDDGSASLNHLVNIFVERHHALYKSQEVFEWLLEGAQVAVDCATEGRTFHGVTVEDWSCVRTTAFPPDSENHFSHFHLYDFSDDMTRLPEEVLNGNGGDEALADMERRRAQEIEQRGGIEGIVHLREEDLRNANPLIVFLRSLLPWVQAEEQNPQNQNQR